MNSFVTIATKKDGTSEVLAGPDVPYEEQKELLAALGEDYVCAEMWSRSQGKIRGRKIKAAPVQKHTEAPAEKTAEVEEKHETKQPAPVEKTDKKSGKKGK